MSTNGILFALVGLTLGVASYTALSLPAGGPGSGPGSNAAQTAALERQSEAIEALRGDVEKLSQRVDRRLGSLERELATGGGGLTARVAVDGESADGAAASMGGAGALEDALAKRMENTLETKMERMAARQRNRGDDGKWKPPMTDLARELGLNETQDAELTKIFDRSRDESYRILATERSDGGSLLDDFVDDLRDTEDFRAAIGGLFKRIVSDKVPGGNETYLSALGRLTEDVTREVERKLDEGQRERLSSLQLDVLDVKTGYDPVGDYVREQLEM